MARLYVNDLLVDDNYEIALRNTPTWPEEHDYNVVVIVVTAYGKPMMYRPNVYWGRGLGREKTELTWFHVSRFHSSYKLPNAYVLEQMIHG